MSRAKHPKKQIEAALVYAETFGWKVRRARGHAWGRMYCPNPHQDCRCGEFCITSIWSTPANADNHARQLRQVVDRCQWVGVRRSR